MKKIYAVLLLLGFSCAVFGQTRAVDGEVIGRHYNDVWQQWSDEPVKVYVDDRNRVYVRGGESLLKAVGYFPGTQLNKVITLLEKSLDWSKKAKESKLEITKPLGSFVRETELSQQGIELVFYSANKGNQTDVILKIQDFDNMFSKIDIYLNTAQVSQLVVLLKKVPATHSELKAQKAKADILK